MPKECPYGNAVENGTTNPATNLPISDELQGAEGEAAANRLGTDRAESTIPRSDSDGEKWLYPSQRMFYNALRRKGFETDSEDVKVMLEVHNFLNEKVWGEILKWESLHKSICGNPTLKRFMGRPKDLTPKARLAMIFGAPRPFDRHDWRVDRCGREVRYIIDYYSGPRGEDHIFYVDVRPALDSWGAFGERFRMFWRRQIEKFKRAKNEINE